MGSNMVTYQRNKSNSTSFQNVSNVYVTSNDEIDVAHKVLTGVLPVRVVGDAVGVGLWREFEIGGC